MDHLSPTALRKVSRELYALENDPPEGIKLIPNNEDTFTDVQAWLLGPEGTPYDGGCFRLRIQLSTDFPHTPPKCYFMTKIFHPNVSKQGDVCVSTLKKDWKPDLGLKHILLVVKCLLIVPNPESALNEEAGRQLLERYDDYAKHAKLMTEIHASSQRNDIFPLKHESRQDKETNRLTSSFESQAVIETSGSSSSSSSSSSGGSSNSGDSSNSKRRHEDSGQESLSRKRAVSQHNSHQQQQQQQGTAVGNSSGRFSQLNATTPENNSKLGPESLFLVKDGRIATTATTKTTAESRAPSPVPDTMKRHEHSLGSINVPTPTAISSTSAIGASAMATDSSMNMNIGMNAQHLPHMMSAGPAYNQYDKKRGLRRL
ncbi:hypothetical protein BG004_001683 [Podila humilis]|nr:hypothetical protein BG004_001683 [Podila humilis]